MVVFVVLNVALIGVLDSYEEFYCAMYSKDQVERGALQNLTFQDLLAMEAKFMNPLYYRAQCRSAFLL